MTTQTNCPKSGAAGIRKRSDDYILLLIFGLVAIAGAVWALPLEKSRTQTIELLPLSATEGELREGVEWEGVSRGVFLTWAQGEKVTMAVQEKGVVYEIVLRGIPVRYLHWAGTGFEYRWPTGGEYEIRDGFLIRALVRDNSVILPFRGSLFAIGVVLLGCSILLYRLEAKRRANA